MKCSVRVLWTLDPISDMCWTVAFASFWSSRFMAHQPVVCSVGPSVLATVVITQEECGMASPPASKLKCIIILF